MTTIGTEPVRMAPGTITESTHPEGMPAGEGGHGVSALERRLLIWLLDGMGNPPVQFVLWNGEEVAVSTRKPLHRILIRNRAALRHFLVNPELHFGDEYAAGRIEVEGDLVECLEDVYRSMARAPSSVSLRHDLLDWLHRPSANSLAAARENIHHHYDLGNDFYQLWLDRNLVYTCAYFATGKVTLEEAQIAKMDLVCRKLRLTPGETVVEAGCGWGALALHMARHYGVRVDAYNISREQLAFARERVHAEGLAGRVEFIEDDYRNIRGEYDVFVSVGMLEHVGLDHYIEFGRVMHNCLTESGRGLIHTIGRNRSMPLNAWVERRIFPGGHPPTLREMMDVFEPQNFSVLDVENLRLHYAETVGHWLARFDAVRDFIEAKHGTEFARAWRLYLAGSKAAFSTGAMQLYQVVFANHANNDLPRTRAHQLDTEDSWVPKEWNLVTS